MNLKTIVLEISLFYMALKPVKITTAVGRAGGNITHKIIWLHELYLHKTNDLQ